PQGSVGGPPGRHGLPLGLAGAGLELGAAGPALPKLQSGPAELTEAEADEQPLVVVLPPSGREEPQRLGREKSLILGIEFGMAMRRLPFAPEALRPVALPPRLVPLQQEPHGGLGHGGDGIASGPEPGPAILTEGRRAGRLGGAVPDTQADLEAG